MKNNAFTSTKRITNSGTIKMSSKSGDDGANNLLMGLPGSTNYQIPKNIFACNSTGLLAYAEGDVINFANTALPGSECLKDNNSQQDSQDWSLLWGKVVLKSVGIGYTITQLKYHPNNDSSFLAVHGNRD